MWLVCAVRKLSLYGGCNFAKITELPALSCCFCLKNFFRLMKRTSVVGSRQSQHFFDSDSYCLYVRHEQLFNDQLITYYVQRTMDYVDYYLMTHFVLSMVGGVLSCWPRCLPATWHRQMFNSPTCNYLPNRSYWQN